MSQKRLKSSAELRAAAELVILPCVFITVCDTFHITHSYLTHCQYKILISAALKTQLHDSVKSVNGCSGSC